MKIKICFITYGSYLLYEKVYCIPYSTFIYIYIYKNRLLRIEHSVQSSCVRLIYIYIKFNTFFQNSHSYKIKSSKSSRSG